MTNPLYAYNIFCLSIHLLIDTWVASTFSYCSVAQWCPTLCDPIDAAHQASLSFTISQSLLKLMSIQSVIPSDHLILSHPLLLLPSIFPSIGSCSVSWHFASGAQTIGASASMLLMNSQDWFPLGLTGLIFLLSKGLSRVFPNTTVQKHQFFDAQPFYSPTLTSIHYYWKTIALTIWIFVSKLISLLFNMLPRFVIAFLPRSKRLLISWLQSPSCSDFRAQENKICKCFHFLPICLPWSHGTRCHDLCLSECCFKLAFSLSSFTFIKGSLDSLHFLP